MRVNLLCGVDCLKIKSH